MGYASPNRNRLPTYTVTTPGAQLRVQSGSDKGWLCSERAGFRKLRVSEDQSFSITQIITDLYQAAKPQRSLMALLEFSKALEH